MFFTTDIGESVPFGQIQCIAVGTPPDEDGSADLQYVMDETLCNYGERADLQRVSGPMDALKGADALLIVTEWRVLRSANFDTPTSTP